MKKAQLGYEVINLNAECSTNAFAGASLVVYKETDKDKLYVRDKKEFLEKFKKMSMN